MNNHNSNTWQRFVIQRPGEWVIETIADIPEPGYGEVLIHSIAFGLCGTDIEVFNGDLSPRWVSYPCSIGHEWVGSVAAIGPGCESVSLHDTVAIEAMNPCLKCQQCLSGMTNLCINYDQFGLTSPGGSSEYVLVPERLLHKLPAGFPITNGVLLEPMAVVMQAIEKLDIKENMKIGIIGLGTLGLLAILVAKQKDPKELVAFGLTPLELENSLLFGVSSCISVLDRNALESSSGFDVVLITTGSSAAMDVATEIVREGGRIATLGIGASEDVMSFSANRIVLKDLSIFGSMTYQSRHWEQALALLDLSSIDLTPIISIVYPLSKVDEAIKSIVDRSRPPGRVVVVHDWDFQ